MYVRLNSVMMENQGDSRFVLQVDLTAYVEKHDFVFDAVLDEVQYSPYRIAMQST